MAARKVVHQFMVEVTHHDPDIAEQHVEALRDVLTQFIRVSPTLLGGVTKIAPITRKLARRPKRNRPKQTIADVLKMKEG